MKRGRGLNLRKTCVCMLSRAIDGALLNKLRRQWLNEDQHGGCYPLSPTHNHLVVAL